jgi:hypothetical protein
MWLMRKMAEDNNLAHLAVAVALGMMADEG